MRSFGTELEWANIDKSVEIPEKLGYWEGKGQHSEVDIINEISGKIFEPAWPNKRWGGEINTTPTTTIDLQCEIFRDLFNLLNRSCPYGQPRVTPISNGHVHVRDDAFDDIEVLKRVYDYTIRNQENIIHYWLSLELMSYIKESPAYHSGAYRYLRNDGGRKLSNKYAEKVHDAESVEEFQRAIVPHAKESGKILWARAGRQGINLHSLRHTGTIEFRCMKASIDPEEMRGQLEFANDFVEFALNDGPDFTEDILKRYKKPGLDPDNLFEEERWLKGLNKWWDTREERKKAGVKSRVGRLKVRNVS